MSLDTIQSFATNSGLAPRDTMPSAIRKTGTENSSIPAANSTATEKGIQPTQAAVEDAVQLLSNFVSDVHPEISFSIDKESGMQIVKIVDTTSDEVIRQIPSEEAVHIAQALDKLQGLFVKDKA